MTKIDMEAKNLQNSDFDENDTIESEKFKELNGACGFLFPKIYRQFKI